MNVTTEYNVDENDYLAFNLFYNSISSNQKRQRKKRWLYVFVFILIFILSSTTLEINNMLRNPLLFLTVLLLIMFILPKKITKKHFQKHIKEVYKTPFFNEITFTDSSIDIKSEIGKQSIYISQIIEINEIEKYYFLHFQTLGQAIIITKEKLSNLSDIEQVIKEISQKYNINYNVNLNWKY